MALGAQFAEHGDGVRNAAGQCIIGIHQQQAVFRKNLGICAEGAQLVREGHDPAMRVRAADGHTEELTGEHVARRLTAADHRRARTVNARIRPLRAAQTEFQHAVAARRLHHAGGLGGDQRLMVDDVEQRGFKKLRFHDRRNDADNRFAGENDRSLRNSQNFAGKPQGGQAGEKRLVKDIQAAQIGNIVLGKMEILDVFNGLLKAGRHGIGRHVALLAIEDIKAGAVIFHAEPQIAVHHRQLIQVGHHCQVAHLIHLAF